MRKGELPKSAQVLCQRQCGFQGQRLRDAREQSGGCAMRRQRSSLHRVWGGAAGERGTGAPGVSWGTHVIRASGAWGTVVYSPAP